MEEEPILACTLATNINKKKSGGFASLSDENDYKAEAIHAALDPKIKELA